MTGRRQVAVVLLSLLAACGERAKAPEPPPTAAQPPPTTPSGPADNVAAPPQDGPPDLRGLSPSQRRAYERGFADCRAGRYEPDNFPEAYRIGCAAAQE
ncbi:MAG TPA: hypothetical protein VJS15_05155 [Allosphingosinicella sp.]|nr:hypothetical protein [Allosphingosinicella sp.]